MRGDQCQNRRDRDPCASWGVVSHQQRHTGATANTY
jgi:hypothetical protein